MSFLRSLARSIHLAGYFVVYGTELLVKRHSTREARADWLHRFAASALHGLGIELAMKIRIEVWPHRIASVAIAGGVVA